LKEKSITNQTNDDGWMLVVNITARRAWGEDSLPSQNGEVSLQEITLLMIPAMIGWPASGG